MENNPSEKEEVSTTTALLVGALAPGVNGQTWNTLKIAFLMLVLCLTTMLALAFSATDSALIIHVTLLVFITGKWDPLLSFNQVSVINSIWNSYAGFIQSQRVVSSRQRLIGNPQQNVFPTLVV